MPDQRVVLSPLDETTLELLLEVAVRESTPEESMPPVPGPEEWSPERQEGFRAYHRGCRENAHETTYAILAEGQVVGAARLASTGRQGVLEAGIWLGRSWRANGLGTATLEALLEEAKQRGAAQVVAETTAKNPAAVGILRNLGARLTLQGPHVTGEFQL